MQYCTLMVIALLLNMYTVRDLENSYRDFTGAHVVGRT